MTEYELKLPNMGESVAEATLTSWLKQKGESVSADEAVVEVATDKVDSEVISEYSGVITAQYFKEGDVVKVGETIAVIVTEGYEKDADFDGVINEDKPTEVEEEEVIEALPEEKEVVEEVMDEKVASEVIEEAIEEVQELRSAPIDVTNSTRFYSPLVKNIAGSRRSDF